MKIERMRKGTVVLNKVDGKKYKVTEIDARFLDPVGIAYELMENDFVDAKDMELGEKSVKITGSNALAFRFLEDTEPFPVPTGYTVEDGILLKNGTLACEQGDVTVNAILADQEDRLILMANRGKNGYVDILSYRVSRDRFLKLLVNVPEPEFICEKNEGSFFGYSDTYEEEEQQEDGTVKTVTKFRSAGIFSIKKGTVEYRYSFNYPINVKDVLIVSSKKDSIGIFVPSDSYVDEETGVVTARDVRRWYSPDYDLSFCADEKIQATYSPLYGWVLKSAKEIYIPGEDELHIQSPDVAKLDGFNHLIDITKEDHTYTFTFSNEQYEFRILTSKATRDRGYIVSVQ